MTKTTIIKTTRTIKIITDNLGEYGKREKKRTFREFFKEQL